MCSVRHSPMPSAPKRRATSASWGRSAFVRTFSRRNSSAQPRMTSNGPVGSGVITGTAPTTTSPVVPLIEITSPSCTITPFTSNTPPPTSMSSAAAPHTAGLPMPRATTAAWLTSPPREVRMPSAAIMPWRSSGRGLGPHQDHVLALAWRASASSAVKYTLPTAAPGDAFRPLASAVLRRRDRTAGAGAGRAAPAARAAPPRSGR